MATVQDLVAVQPGSDAKIHTQNLQQNVAGQLTAATGKPVTADQVTPPDQTLQDLTEGPKPQTDWEDFMAGEKGRPRTDSSKNFLRVLLGRLKRQYPGDDIKQK